jgi:hypothetical protein
MGWRAESNVKTELCEQVRGESGLSRPSIADPFLRASSADGNRSGASLPAVAGNSRKIHPLWLLLLCLGFMTGTREVRAIPDPGSVVPGWTATAADMVRVTDPIAPHTQVLAGGGNALTATADSDQLGDMAILYVDPDAPGTVDGKDWAGAYNHLQDALTAAASRGVHVEIHMAEGVYRPDTSASSPKGTRDRNASFRLGNVTLIGGYAGFGAADPNLRDVDRHPTILSGDLGSDDTESTPTLDLPTAPNRADNSLHVIRGSPAGPATIRGLTVTGGNANSPTDSMDGGAVLSDEGSHPITLERCTFTRNAALGKGGAVCQYGHGNSSYTCGEILSCKFIVNDANEGGAVANINGSSNCENCIFLRNMAFRFGAAMYLSNTRQTVSSCTFAWNHTPFTGVTSESYSDETPQSYAGAIRYGQNTSLTITNSILWDNTELELSHMPPSRITVTHSTVRVNLFLMKWTGNIADFVTANGCVRYSTVDPLLTPDGHLRHDSPCIDSGDPNFRMESNHSGDVDGEDRVQNGRIDMGADEFLDTDEDTLPDWWEWTYDGDPDADPDGDGLTNREEYNLYGSHPLRPPLCVDGGNTGDAMQDGTDAHPFATLQAGLDHARDGDTVLVAPGQYRDANHPLLSYHGKAVVLKGREGADRTVLDDRSFFSDFWFDSGESPGAAIVGFTGSSFYCSYSSPQIRECVIRHNSPPMSCVSSTFFSAPVLADCRILDDAQHTMYFDSSRIRIEGTVELSDRFSAIDSVFSGRGTLEVNPDRVRPENADLVLKFYLSTIQCSIEGPATILVPGELTIESDAVIDLHGGHVICDGLLHLSEHARLSNAWVDVKRMMTAGNAIITNCVVGVESGAPFGQFFVEDDATVDLPLVKADGDRYLDLDPSAYDCNNLRVDEIQVTITEGVGGTRGGLFELRDTDRDADRFRPEELFCQVSSIPDFSPGIWTISRLELLDDAKLNLTNRFDFQAPFDSGGSHEVLYVKDLILGDRSILNTAFNRLYYENLVMAPTAQVVNVPLLGFSLNNISFDDENDYLARVTTNNAYVSSSSGPYVQRILKMQPDPNGMMRMRNEQGVHAVAKGLFAKSDEDKITVAFEYLFDTTDPTVELAIYLSDVPELLDGENPLRERHYVQVGRLSPPPMGRPGSKGSGRFGAYYEAVSRGELDFIKGTRIELELIGPDGSCAFINNWDPQIHCSQTYCADVTGDLAVTVMDFLTVVAEFGGSAGLLDDGTSTACLDGIFSDDGTIDSDDILSWDWQLGASDRLNLCHVPLAGAVPPVTVSSAAVQQSRGRLKTLEAPSLPFSGEILIAGKAGASSPSSKLEDRIVAFDTEGRGLTSLGAAAPRGSTELILDGNGELYQLNSENGLTRLADGEAVVPPGTAHVASEPRHGMSATVSIGLLQTSAGWSGRPLLDAAFDAEGSVYVVPAIVTADGIQPYTVAAKLRLCPEKAPPYEVVMIYDDPPVTGDNQERDHLRSLEVDDEENLYVINACRLNESDVLWVYDQSTGELRNRADLVSPDRPILIPAPAAFCASRHDKSLYITSSRTTPGATSTAVYKLSSQTLSVEKVITVDGVGHITDIAEDPTTGDLWVVGLIMTTIPEYVDDLAPPFYHPCLAKVPAHADGPVQVLPLQGTCDLALPLSIVCTGGISIGGSPTEVDNEPR